MNAELTRPRWLNALIHATAVAFPISFIGNMEVFTGEGGRSAAVAKWALWFLVLWPATFVWTYFIRKWLGRP